MQETVDVVAILCSDIHLSQNKPVARQDKDDWFLVMREHLDELGEIATEHEVPIIFAGDLFDHWKSAPELINFAMNRLPQMYTIPGQHDLPNHNYEEINRSAYRTLSQAGRIMDMIPTKSCSITSKGHHISVRAFPWGFLIKPADDPNADIKLAVVHAYIWREGYGFHGAPVDRNVTEYDKQLASYDAAVFGDNHIPFQYTTSTGCHVMNTGGFMRRRADDVKWNPGVGLLMSDGTIIRQELECAKLDVISREHITDERLINDGLKDFVTYLSETQKDSLDFEAAVKEYMTSHDVSQSVRTIITEAMGR